jgi:hypothetical protein
MLMALIGAFAAQLLLARLHDRQIANLATLSRPITRVGVGNDA